MKLNRPKPKNAVRLVAYDLETGKSKSMTVFETSPKEVIDGLKKLATGAQRQPQLT